MEEIRRTTLVDLMRQFVQDLREGRTIALDVDKCAGDSESCLEDDFWHFVRKMDVQNMTSIKSQVQILNYRVDSLFEFGGRKVIVELDGKAYHDPTKDWRRDTQILEGGFAHEIIRIPYVAMHWYPDATMACLGHWHGEMLTRRPMFCMTATEFKDELKSLVDTPPDYHKLDAVLERTDPDYDLYHVCDDYALIGGTKAFWYDWKMAVMTRRRVGRESAAVNRDWRGETA